MIRRLEARLVATEAQGRLTGIDAEFVVAGAFDDQQVAKLQEAAATCRVSRALSVPLTSRVTVGP